jgi:hypothetical protein
LDHRAAALLDRGGASASSASGTAAAGGSAPTQAEQEQLLAQLEEQLKECRAVAKKVQLPAELETELLADEKERA